MKGGRERIPDCWCCNTE